MDGSGATLRSWVLAAPRAVRFGSSDLAFLTPRGKSSTAAQAGNVKVPGWRQKDRPNGAVVLTAGVA